MGKFRLGMRPQVASEVLNWETILAPGVLGCKDGSLVAGWALTGIDIETMSEDEVAPKLDRIAQAFQGFGDGETFWVILDRRHGSLEPELLAEHVTQATSIVANEIEDYFTQPGTLLENKLWLFYQYKPEFADLPFAEQRAEFEDRTGMIEDRLRVVFGMERLRSETSVTVAGEPCELDPLVGALDRIATLSSRAAPVTGSGDVAEVAPIDILLSEELDQGGLFDRLSVATRPVETLAFDSMRASISWGILRQLESLPLEYLWISRFACQSPHKARARAEQARKERHQRSVNLKDQLVHGETQRYDMHAEQRVDEADEWIAAIDSGADGFGTYCAQVRLHGAAGQLEEDFAKDISTVTKAFADIGIESRRERINGLEAWLGSLPGHANHNQRTSVVSTSSWAGLLPIRSIWQGEALAPLPSLRTGTRALVPARAVTGEAFHFNLHREDLGHTLVLGPSRSGKSVLLGLLATRWLRYENAQVIMFDKQCSSRHLAHAQGGTFIDLDPSQSSGIAPFKSLNDLGEEWALRWITTMAKSQGVTVGAATTRSIQGGLSLTSKETTPSLRRFSENVEDQAVKDAVNVFTVGDRGQFFNAGGLDVDWKPFTVFECHELLKGEDAVLAELALDYVFARVEQQLASSKPTLIIIDEAWAFMRHAMFRERLLSWIKEAGKLNVALVLASQSISDISKSDLKDHLLENSATRIFLPNDMAASAELRDSYERLGLSGEQIEMVAAIRPKAHYYIMKSEGARVVDFCLGPVTLAIIGQTSRTASTRAASFPPGHAFWKEDVAKAQGVDI